MRKFEDLTGKKFGKLTVIKYVFTNKNKKRCWLCKCDCGNEKIIPATLLVQQKVKSCGCLRKNYFDKKHGLRNSRLYNIWCNMKSRCNNAKNPCYKNYGGRGITICEEWKEFLPFYNWAMANGYKDNLTIDRINNDGNYCPENCRWTTWETQFNNRSDCHYISYNGITKTFTEWCKTIGISREGLKQRFSLGWSIEKALTTKVRTFK